MEHAEANGKTVDDALRVALAKLNATVEEVEIVVLDEGQRGGRLFGRGARDAVVRVERRARGTREQADAAPPETSVPRDRGRGRSGGAVRDRRPRRGRNPGEGPGAGRSPRGRSPERAPQLTEQDFFGEGDTPPARAPLRGGRRSSSAPQRSASPRSASPRSAPPRSAPPRSAPPRRDRRRREEEEIEPDINAEEVELAAEVVDAILQILEIDADINIREPVTPGDGLGSARAVIDISGNDLGMLIGRRGDSLKAFQYVVNLVMTRHHPGRGSVTIDIEQYRRRREDQLVSLADRMADRVRENGEPITLEPMSAADRRLVHIALAGDSEVETDSTGEGESRKVVISLQEE